MSEKPYSDFLRIDLHIHTDKSKQTKANDYKGIFSVSRLHEKMTENHVEIFSLTDHNCLNVEAYEEYYTNYSGEDEPLLLIGTELDVVVEDKRYHSLIIFCHHDIDHVRRISGALEDYYESNGYELTERIITLDKIVELFPSDDFFFIPHAGSGSNSLVDAYKGDIPYAQKMLLLMPSCALEKVKQKAISKYNDGFSSVMPEGFRNKGDIAYIQFSDNHNIERYPLTHKGENDVVHKFYYVKGGKNFETLRQAFIDPQSRIKSEDELSSLSRLQDPVEGLKINNCPRIKNVNLLFSPHLNVIIGGRSSGKSLLMNLFGKCIDRLPENEIYGQLLEGASIQIKTKREAGYSEQSSIDAEPIWIAQGDIIRYFEQGHLDELARKVGREEERKQSRQSLTDKCNKLRGTLDELHDAYDNAYQGLNERSYILHDKTISASLSDTFTVKFDKSEISAELSSNTESQQEAEKILQAIIGDLGVLKSNQYIKFTEAERSVVLKFKNMIIAKQEHIQKMGSSIRKRTSFIEEVGNILDATNEELGDSAQKKADATRDIDQIPVDIKDKFTIAKHLYNITKKVSALQCREKEEFLLHEKTKFVVEAISEDSPEELLLDAIKGAEPQRSLYYNMLRLLFGEKSVKNLGGSTPQTLKKKTGVVFAPLFNCYSNPVESLEYADSSTSKGNSPGFNSEKYLEILLANAREKLVFIDQPEDNLGNNFIAEKLVTMIRTQKFKGQVFLVTHNPAIVVYGDSESIIVAENNNGTISYEQLVLENRDAQKRVCEILDGGEYIFDRRAKKYNIQRILRESGQSYE
jgi:predicted ATP-dependent endonuclease of OLD family